jgi:hypothetical protein
MNTKVLGISVFVTTILAPQVAIAGPILVHQFERTPYGPLICADRAVNILGNIGATKISNIAPGFFIARLQNASIEIICRGGEVLVIVAGPPYAEAILRDLIRVF